MNDTIDDVCLSPGETTPPPLEEDIPIHINSQEHMTDDSMSMKPDSKQGSGYYIQKDAMILSEPTLTRHATPLPTDLVKTDTAEMVSTLNAIQEGVSDVDEENKVDDKNLEAILLNTPYGGKKGQAIAQALEFSSSVAEELKTGVE